MIKIVIVTGATRGIGFAVARQCIADGYKVIAVGRTMTGELASLLHQHPERLVFEQYDFFNTSGIHSFAVDIVRKYGRPWGLVNNAAIGRDGVLATLHERDIVDSIKINIEAPILLTKYILRSMLINRGGRIINVSSIIATRGFNGLSVYGATKAALLGFTKSLSREVGKVGITVNALALGYMETGMTSTLKVDQLACIKRRSSSGRFANVEDVAYAVSYLLSEQSSSVTGTTLTVDAGSSA